MKKNLFSFLIFVCPFMLNAQVNFLNFDSFDALLEQAKKEKKLIFIQFQSEKCVQCFDVATTGLSSTQLKEKYAVNFLSLSTKLGDKLYANLLDKYALTNDFMGSLYLDNQGKELLKISSTTSFAMSYIQWADSAIENVNKLKSLENLEKNYQKGDKTSAFLEKHILSMRDLGKYDDAIMDEYIGKLVVDSLYSDRIIQFVKEQGLSLNSKAYKLVTNLNSNKKIDSIWYLMPLSKRIKINNRTSFQTFSEAVKTKNTSLMYQLANFTQNIYNPNYRKGEFTSQVQFTDYYRAVKDTVGFLNRAQSFATTLLRINTDSLKAWNTQEREEVFSTREPEKIFRPASNQYADELNKLAWYCYELTDNPKYLEKALTWSERSMVIFKEIPAAPVTENATYLDTYAHLLYKLKRYDEAVEWQNKAIEAQKAGKIKSAGFEKERDKMINRKL